MSTEQMLKLQAYLDGELPDGEAQAMSAWLAGSTEAQAVAAELRMTRAFLAGNETPVQLPETREFYWSKIERAIARTEASDAATRHTPWWLAWRRLLVPAGALALATGFTLLTARFLTTGTVEDTARHLAVVENLSDETESLAFSSQTENMFVVWIHSKDGSAPPDSEFDPESTEEMIYQ